LALFLGLAAAWLPWGVFAADPTNGPLKALGLTNVPLGNSTLELVDNGVLFVHDSIDGGVSVLLGEAEAGVFLYPLTGDAYEGYWMEGKAYGRFAGVTNQLVSTVRGDHVGNSRGTVTVNFSALGATRLSVFVDSTFIGRISNSVAVIDVQGNAQGCRANPWWRLPDGSFGAMVELAYSAWLISVALAPDHPVDLEAGRTLFIRPDDPTNSVEFISSVDVTAGGFGSFCLTDARVGMFYHGHKALGQATLSAVTNRLVVGNLTSISNVEDGVFVELPSVTAFDMDLVPLELPGTNALLMVSGYGTAGLQAFTALGTLRIDNPDGRIRLGVEMGIAPQTTDVLIRSNGVVVGSVSMPSSEFVSLSGTPRIVGCAISGKTLQTQPGFGVRVDRLTAFTVAGQTLEGDEVRLLAPDPVVFETLESFVMVSQEVSSFTIAGERAAYPTLPELRVLPSTNQVTLLWPDPNRLFVVEATSTLTNAFEVLTNPPVMVGDMGSVTVDSSESGQRFFRLQRRPPGSD